MHITLSLSSLLAKLGKASEYYYVYLHSCFADTIALNRNSSYASLLWMCSELHRTYEYYNLIFPEVLQGVQPIIDFLLPSLLISKLYFTFCIPADHKLARVYLIECIRDIRRPGVFRTHH